MDDLTDDRSVGFVSRRERRRAETRERLFDAALKLLCEHDFDAVTVEMITETADVGKGTFFNYFANKEAIVGAMFQEQFERLKSALTARPSETDNGGRIKVRERMIEVTQLAAERDGRNRRLTRTLLALSLTNPDVRVAHNEVRLQVIDALRALVRAGQIEGEVRSDVSAEDLASFLAGVYLSTMILWAEGDTEGPLANALKSAYALAWEGLGPALPA